MRAQAIADEASTVLLQSVVMQPLWRFLQTFFSHARATTLHSGSSGAAAPAPVWADLFDGRLLCTLVLMTATHDLEALLSKAVTSSSSALSVLRRHGASVSAVPSPSHPLRALVLSSPRAEAGLAALRAGWASSAQSALTASNALALSVTPVVSNLNQV